MSVYWIAELPDAAPYTGSDSRIAVDAGGVVHILYVNGTTSSLRYAQVANELDLKHIFAVNITRLPPPGHQNKRPILHRPE